MGERSILFCLDIKWSKGKKDACIIVLAREGICMFVNIGQSERWDVLSMWFRTRVKFRSLIRVEIAICWVLTCVRDKNGERVP